MTYCVSGQLPVFMPWVPCNRGTCVTVILLAAKSEAVMPAEVHLRRAAGLTGYYACPRFRTR
jgi:hypothetical protein